jgi:serine/threonine protein kinase
MMLLSPLLDISSATAALPVGTRIGGFVVDEVLSHSDVAVVYRVTDDLLQRPLALKEHFPRALYRRGDDAVLQQAAAHAGPAIAAARQAFLDEARQLAKLDIPGLLRVSAVFEANGTVYRVMPLHDAPTLAEARATSGAADAQTLRRLLAGVLTPLQALHAAGLAHGAVAPDQVLWLDDALPLLLGFGAVRRVLATAPPGVGAAAATADLEAVAALAQFAISGEPPTPGAEAQRTDPPALALVPPALSEAEAEPGSEAAVRAAIASMLESIPPAPPRPPARPTLLAEGSPVLNDLVPPDAPLPRPPAARRGGGWRWALLALLSVGAAAAAWQWQQGSRSSQNASAAQRVAAVPASVATETPAVTPPAPASASVAEAVPRPASAPLASEPSAPAPAASLPVAGIVPSEPAPPPRAADRAAPPRSTVAKAVSPRDTCGARSNFSLYQCMQTQCRKPQFSAHSQCRTLRETGEVG